MYENSQAEKVMEWIEVDGYKSQTKVGHKVLSPVFPRFMHRTAQVMDNFTEISCIVLQNGFN